MDAGSTGGNQRKPPYATCYLHVTCILLVKHASGERYVHVTCVLYAGQRCMYEHAHVTCMVRTCYVHVTRMPSTMHVACMLHAYNPAHIICMLGRILL